MATAATQASGKQLEPANRAAEPPEKMSKWDEAVGAVAGAFGLLGEATSMPAAEELQVPSWRIQRPRVEGSGHHWHG